MDADTYCKTVCGGKCCYLHPVGEDPVKCPKQHEDGSCSVYHKRYGPLADEPIVVVGYWHTNNKRDIHGNPIMMPFGCGRIKDLLAQRLLHPDVEKQCCYAHPELLDI